MARFESPHSDERPKEVTPTRKLEDIRLGFIDNVATDLAGIQVRSFNGKNDGLAIASLKEDPEFQEDQERFERDFNLSAQRFEKSDHFKELKDRYPEVFEERLYADAVDRVANTAMFENGVRVWNHNGEEQLKAAKDPNYEPVIWSYGMRLGDSYVERLLTREIVREAKRLKKIADQQEIFKKYARRVEWGNRVDGLAKAIKEVKGNRDTVIKKNVPVLLLGMPGVPEGKGVILNVFRRNDDLKFSMFGGRAGYSTSFDYGALKSTSDSELVGTIIEWVEDIARTVKNATPKAGGFMEMEKYFLSV